MAESYKTYMASMTFTAPTNWGFLGGSTLSGCVINGYNSSLAAPADETSLWVGTTLTTPVTGLKFGACYDYILQGGPQASGAGGGYANCVGLYASFQATEKLSFYARGEYGSTDLGVFGPATGENGHAVAATGVIETTATVQYDLWKNVLSRLEFRWDHAEHGNMYGGTVAPITGTASTATGNNYFTLLADIAYKF